MMTRSESSLIFLGDLKGTQSALASITTAGKEQLSHRLSLLHAAFAKSFLSFADRSLSLRAITLSDSVIAEWNDVPEGFRFAGQFARSVWNELGDITNLFRGFIDSGHTFLETDPMLLALDGMHRRFVRVIPVSIAIWSTSLAEKSHFPPGIYVGSRVAPRIRLAEYESTVYKADNFEFKRIKNI